MAALDLSGVKGAIIRPTDSPGGPQGFYELMVPPENLDAAQAALQKVHLSQLNLGSAPAAVKAMQALKASGIPATVRFLREPGWSKSSERLFAVFVSTADAESTQKVVGGLAHEVEF